VLLVLLLVAAAIVVVVLLVNQDDDEPTGNDKPTRSTRQSSEATTESSSSEATTPTTTAEPEMVTIDPDDYVGRDRFEVEAELQRLGLNVEFVEETNPGGEDEDTVASVNPTGDVPVDSSIEVHWWGAPPATTPTTDTTTPTDTAGTETGTTTEGGDG
jgi:cytoskeletal protein RodZ